jgi:hypothetical protein
MERMNTHRITAENRVISFKRALMKAATILVLGLAAIHLGKARAQTEIYDFTTIAGALSSGAVDGTNRAARFNNPMGIALDNRGNIYLADWSNHTIRKLTPSGTNWVTTTLAGQAGSPGNADGTNSAARFNMPWGIGSDSSGNLYVADNGNNTVRKLTPVGIDWVSSTIAGMAGRSGSVDGTNNQTRFNGPIGIAVDGAGNVYASDGNNNTVRKLTPAGTNWVSSTIAGLAGSPGSADGTNSRVRFNAPIAIALDSASNLYVADHDNFTIRKLTPSGTNWVSTTIAGLAGHLGSADGTNSAARFAYALSVAVDGSGHVYVAENGNSTIRKLTPVGTNWVSSTIGGRAGFPGSADGTNSAARFNGPTATVDSSGDVFVADSTNNTIREGVPLSVLLMAPILQNLFLTKSSVTLTWTASAGRKYQLEYSSDLSSTNWQNLGDIVTATSGTMSDSDSLGTDRQRFYRVLLLP